MHKFTRECTSLPVKLDHVSCFCVWWHVSSFLTLHVEYWRGLGWHTRQTPKSRLMKCNWLSTYLRFYVSSLSFWNSIVETKVLDWFWKVYLKRVKKQPNWAQGKLRRDEMSWVNFDVGKSTSLLETFEVEGIHIYIIYIYIYIYGYQCTDDNHEARLCKHVYYL